MKREEWRDGGVFLEVAPHAGAWIETVPSMKDLIPRCRSPPTRGRGLKLRFSLISPAIQVSPPTRGRGLKRCYY